MIKSKELSDQNSCMNRAKDNEMTFVLLGRDEAAPAAIRAWVAERIRRGKNQPEDKQIKEALESARVIEESWVDRIREDYQLSKPALNIANDPGIVRCGGVGRCHEIHAYETIGRLLALFRTKSAAD